MANDSKEETTPAKKIHRGIPEAVFLVCINFSISSLFIL